MVSQSFKNIWNKTSVKNLETLTKITLFKETLLVVRDDKVEDKNFTINMSDKQKVKVWNEYFWMELRGFRGF